MVPKYSILCFYPDIILKNMNEIKNYIQNGIKVYFLTFDDEDELQENAFFRNANQKGFFSMHIVRYSEFLNNREIMIIDGNCEDIRLLDYFDQNSSFNKDQYILEHAEGSLQCLVKAGAGTGKTTTMINRLMFLKHLNNDLDLTSIVMITFTNEAASNMRLKVLEKLKNYFDLTQDRRYLEWIEETGKMFIGTIHAFAKEFLSMEGRKIGYSRTMQIRSYRYDRRKAIERSIDDFSIDFPEIYRNFRYIPHYWLVRSVEDMIEQIQNKSISEDEVCHIDFGNDAQGFNNLSSFVIKNVMKDQLERKQRDDSLEISDLISRLGSLKQIPKENFTMKLNYLFVDEFQDTDETQLSFITWLVQNYSPQLFAVGDVKQSIYRFRGADYTAFDQVKQQLRKNEILFREFSLRKNYRSEPKLLLQFNQLFEKWKTRVAKFQFDKSDLLLPVKEDGNGEGLTTMKLDDVDLLNVLNRLQNKDVAILVRSNRQVLDTVKRVESLGYFCEASISGSFYRSLSVREFYLLLRRLTHPNVPKERYLFHQSSYGENIITIAQVLKAFTQEKSYILDLLSPLENTISAVQWNSMSAIAALEDIIKEVKPENVFRKRYFSKMRIQFPNHDPEIQKSEAIAKMKEYKVNLERLLFILKKEFGDFQASTYDLEKFMSIKMATDNINTEWKMEKEISHRIKVMTVHKAKGQEFDYVILPLTNSAFIKKGKKDLLLIPDLDKWKLGYRINWDQNEVTNNHYDLLQSEEKTETVGEEARLLYVALTRAKKGVIANSSTSLNSYLAQSWSDLLESGEMLFV